MEKRSVLQAVEGRVMPALPRKCISDACKHAAAGCESLDGRTVFRVDLLLLSDEDWFWEGEETIRESTSSDLLSPTALKVSIPRQVQHLLIRGRL